MYYTGAEYLTNDFINKIIATTNAEEKINMVEFTYMIERVRKEVDNCTMLYRFNLNFGYKETSVHRVYAEYYNKYANAWREVKNWDSLTWIKANQHLAIPYQENIIG